MVFPESLAGIANRTDDASLNVFESSGIVDHDLPEGIIEQGVHREIAPPGIGLRIREGNFAGMPAVLIEGVLAESSHLVPVPVSANPNHPE